jgi:RNA polymerase sigma-70 factor (ECF subfamily)
MHRVRRAALLRDGGGLTDGQLLASFVERRDEDAFEALVRRHGPMVLGVCRRLLRHAHDAEDAFQATFLVLARKAASLRSRELVGNWLYGTAYRTALGARGMIARRQARERQVEDMPEPLAEAAAPWADLLPLLDQELNRLPEKYRVPVVLCELEGKSRKEAARLLGLPEGTLSWRLARARQLLARRLARFGPAAPASVLALAGPRAVPPSLLVATARSVVSAGAGKVLAAGAISARVAALAEGVVRAMLLSKLKVVPAVVLALVVGAGAASVTYRAVAAEPGPVSPEARAAQDDLEALRLEVEALRKELRVTREQVKELRAEVQNLKGQAKAAAPNPPGGKTLPADVKNLHTETYNETYNGKTFTFFSLPDDPVATAEEALKKLRANPDDKQAAEALERASKQLKERAKPQAAPANPQKN